MTGHPLTVAAALAGSGAIQGSTYAAMVYAMRGATPVSRPAACWVATAALAEDALTAPYGEQPTIAELGLEITAWAEAA